MRFRRSDAYEKRAEGGGITRTGLLLVAGFAVTVAGGGAVASAADQQATPSLAEEAESAGPTAAPPSNAEAEERRLPAPIPPMLRAASFRTSSDLEREPSSATVATGDDAVMLRMMASEDVAVPIENLNDALVTTGSIARGTEAPTAPPAPQRLPAVVASLLPTQPAAQPMPAAYSAPTTRPMPDGGLSAVERNFDSSAAATAPDGGTPVIEPDRAAAGQAGRIVSSVNMRTKPDGSARTLSILASNSTVTVISCEYWCEVEAAGKRGFVYKRFVKTR